MAQLEDTITEQIFSESGAVVSVLVEDIWHEFENGNSVDVQLTRRNIPPNITNFRLRGQSRTTGQFIMDVELDNESKYEITQEPLIHRLKTKTNVYSLRMCPDSKTKEFAFIVQTTINSIQENSPPKPREAWIPPVSKQPSPKLPSRTSLMREIAPNPFDAGKYQTLPPQFFLKQPSLSKSLSASTMSLTPTAPRPMPQATSNHSSKQEIENACEKLSDAISKGDELRAIEATKLMISKRIHVAIMPKSPSSKASSANESFSIRVKVEDRASSGCAFEIKVFSLTTIKALKEEVENRYGFPTKVQKWIVGKKMAKATDTLEQLNIKGMGYTAFLYLVSAKSVGLTKQECDRCIKKSEKWPALPNDDQSVGVQVPRPTIPVRNGNVSRPASIQLGAQANSGTIQTAQQTSTFERESQISNSSLPGRVPVPPRTDQGTHQNNPAEMTLFNAAKSCEDIEKMLHQYHGLYAEEPQERLGMEESIVEPQGWSCPSCTFVNSATRPGCEVCGSSRPADYVVPQNPRITEQERLRLMREQEETQIFERTINRQQQEQEHERELNFRQLVETAQQNLIRNTEEFDCAICLTPCDPGEGVVLRECLHSFCEDCLRMHIKNCTDPEVQCPFQDDDFACHFIITAQEIKALLIEEDFNKFLSRSLATAESQASNSFHCKTPNCPGWCIYEDNTNVFHCPVCQKVNCLTCKAIHHPDMNCKEYQEDLQRRAQDDVAAKQTQKYLEQMIDKGDAMKCPQCDIILLKKDGCDWMRCSMCRMEICWATRGPRWGPLGVGDISGGCKCRVGGKRCHPKCKNCH